MAGKGQGGGGPEGKVEGANILIIEARYYEDIADELLAGAVAVIEAAGATAEKVSVPGALEIAQVIQMAGDGALDYDGIVALGCVIRGETSHYDIVCNNANHWLYDAAAQLQMPVGNGILTVDPREQAMARATGGIEGKGGDAARAVLRLIEIRRAFEERAG
ncbi:MAG: 6,7-dimethyl-8-ribityllumazine synthase [Hyphomicrobiaceae bacterium]|nr:6,7-dimethyl-8-ribityllumazine synthase [Hyphomicrobiaceae bacterium]